jgi:hypothetical protein
MLNLVSAILRFTPTRARPIQIDDVRLPREYRAQEELMVIKPQSVTPHRDLLERT